MEKEDADDPLQAAEWWIDRGFLPVPIPYREKAPVLDGWQRLRLTKLELPMYFNGAQQNIGVLVGDANGTADIDCDCVEAVAAAAEFAPQTGLVFGRHSKPASHYFYRCMPVVRSRKFIDPASKKTIVELRCQKASGAVGLQTVVPPSVHESGEQVRFEPGYDGQPAEVAANVLTDPVRQIAAASLLARHWPEEGSRHDAFLALAGTLRRAGWQLARAVVFHRAIYRVLWLGSADMQACAKEVESTYQKHDTGVETTGFQTLSGLVNRTALKTALSWIGAGVGANPAQVIEWPEVVPLLTRNVTPLSRDFFPGFLGDMVSAVSKATETPIELAGMLGLAVTAACVAKKITISPEPGYLEPVNIYTAAAMESGNRKTAVLNRMAGPFIEWEHAERDRLAPEQARTRSERRTLEAQIEVLRKKAARAPYGSAFSTEIADLEASLPQPPVVPRLWTQDITPEQLAVVMAENGERMAVLSDEGGIFDLLAGRYSKGIPNLDLFLQAHSGGSVRIDRGSKPPIMMRNPSLTVAISPQPHVLQRLQSRPEFRGRGLLARMLYTLPPSPLGFRRLVSDPVPHDVEQAYNKGIHRLLQLQPAFDADGKPCPWELRFSSDAYASWKEFQRFVEELMKEGGKLYYIKDWASKLPGAAARVAGVLHCIETDSWDSSVISTAVTERALNLAAALIDHALAVFDLMQRDPVIEDAKRVLRWISRQKDGKFTIRDCFCFHQAHFRTMEAMGPAVRLLEQHGYIRPAPKPNSTGRPTVIYDINSNLPEVET